MPGIGSRVGARDFIDVDKHQFPFLVGQCQCQEPDLAGTGAQFEHWSGRNTAEQLR